MRWAPGPAALTRGLQSFPPEDPGRGQGAHAEDDAQRGDLADMSHTHSSRPIAASFRSVPVSSFFCVCDPPDVAILTLLSAALGAEFRRRSGVGAP